ncbi:MAG: O-sialoglycoprotein endopeptidase [Candidatus Saganbacteria bacterium]|uniref:tRNA N6-adenosine threonylcarbamoyltransferase n=1 Tax=Candidatus Saganbacteria bacterium TaxID=2575572 RepID=A0A833L0E0_UNCSA|nr:MAG: O-sialoglycoprotein endopeptidase [Candidatus Saganbacteria bacterium]
MLSNVIASQIEFHKKYGGIVPEVASRKHAEVINLVIQEALDKSKTTFKNIDAVAVTQGPGLIGSLLVGVCAAKSISYAMKIPLIAVNHLEGHMFANFLSSPLSFPSPSLMERGVPSQSRDGVRFPFISLIVSGGHTMIVKADKEYEILGQTRDDAAGEAFDKVARFLNLGFPGGPVIDQLAKQGNPHAIEFKRPMLEKEFGYDFSFSGIKTAVVNYVMRNTKNVTRDELRMTNYEDIVASFQQAVVDVLVEKTIRAAKAHKIKNICLAGGVSANSLLRKQFTEHGKKEKLNVFIPSIEYTTDNAAMIACAAYQKFLKKDFSDSLLRPSQRLKL